jgi:hypothetical protein
MCLISLVVLPAIRRLQVNEHELQGTGRSTKEILKRIDYGGSLTLLGAVSLKSWTFFFIKRDNQSNQSDFLDWFLACFLEHAIQRRPSGTSFLIGYLINKKKKNHHTNSS